MARSSNLIAVCALALFACASTRAQDTSSPSPSLGDVARQAQKDKDKDKPNKPAAKIFTNEDLPSGAGGGTSAVLGVVLDSSGKPTPGQAGANLSPEGKLAQLDRLVEQVASVDKATLVRNVLKDKSDVDFPGRAAWEKRLFAARDTYVLQARAVLQKSRQILASADSLKGTQDPNDPRVKEINGELQAFARDAVQADAGFVAVIDEGRDLATQSPVR